MLVGECGVGLRDLPSNLLGRARLAIFADDGIGELGPAEVAAIEALPGGTMVFSGLGGGSFVNSGANINANGTSNAQRARVNLMDGATILGGTITSNTFGQFFIPGTHSATLSGVAFYEAKGYTGIEHVEVPLTNGATLPILRMGKTTTP